MALLFRGVPKPPDDLQSGVSRARHAEASRGVKHAWVKKMRPGFIFLTHLKPYMGQKIKVASASSNGG